MTGVQRYAYNLGQRIGELAFLTPAPAQSVYGEIATQRVCVRPSALKSHLWEQIIVPRNVRKGDVVWSPTSIGPWSAPNHVVTVHDIASLEHPEWYGNAYARLYRALQPPVVRRARKIISVSEFTKRRLIETLNIPADRIVVIYEGLDAAFKPQDPAEVRAALDRVGIGQRYLLALGAVSPRKNFRRLLEAWQTICMDFPDVELIVVGETGLLFSGNASIGSLPPRTRHLTGVGDELLVKLFSGAIAFLYPSLYEGFGLPILEAMATGAPVLTSNVTSLPEVAGEAAIFVDPLNTADIASGMRRLIADDGLRASLRLAGIDRVRQFRWDAAAQETRRLLLDCINGL